MFSIHSICYNYLAINHFPVWAIKSIHWFIGPFFTLQCVELRGMHSITSAIVVYFFTLEFMLKQNLKTTFPCNMFALALMFTLCRYLSVNRALAVSLDKDDILDGTSLQMH